MHITVIAERIPGAVYMAHMMPDTVLATVSKIVSHAAERNRSN